MSLRSEVADLAPEHLQCRYPNHAWRNGKAYRTGRLITVKWTCSCGAHATDTLNSDGSIAKPRSIKYDEGYLIPGHGRIDRAVFRREAVQRMGFSSNGDH